MKLGLTPDEAAEVFQDVFESLLRNLEKLQDRDRVASWLYTAARRLSIRRVSSRRRRDRLEKPAEQELARTASKGPSIVERMVRAELHGRVIKSLEALSKRCRDLLWALFFDPAEPDYDTISSRLGIARGSIGPTRARCLKKLRQSLE